MDVVGERPIGSPYSALWPVFRLSSVDRVERVRIEQVRKVADGVGEIHEPIVEGPFRMYLDTTKPNAKSGGWPASSAAAIFSGSSACS